MISGRCAACKYLRRSCPSNCIFSPYFPSNDPQRFACVHRIFGASNVGKMLQRLPPDRRAEAADSMHFEAKCRIEFPVYGCVGIISQLHQEIQNVETQLATTRAEIAFITSSNNTIQEAQLRDDQYYSSLNNNFMQPQHTNIIGQSDQMAFNNSSWML
ncbi:Lateral organ boundaries domain containing protein [Parasponia andersonii]|uniref:Lateral organ boundaries domain containing protein n=1 Tax=Parasponia andersonii TaxID=3476 RepID=A0A2P5AXS9_PARAD|nr:Lateral organ boundaries domain containing protein [Parasponia andersonii]